MPYDLGTDLTSVTRSVVNDQCSTSCDNITNVWFGSSTEVRYGALDVRFTPVTSTGRCNTGVKTFC